MAREEDKDNGKGDFGQYDLALTKVDDWIVSGIIGGVSSPMELI